MHKLHKLLDASASWLLAFCTLVLYILLSSTASWYDWQPAHCHLLKLRWSTTCITDSCEQHLLGVCLCRHKGVLQVWVLEAKELHKQDIGGKADPFVQLQTRVQDLEKTVGLR